MSILTKMLKFTYVVFEICQATKIHFMRIMSTGICKKKTKKQNELFMYKKPLTGK